MVIRDNFHKTRHVGIRNQQRGIKSEDLQCLLSLGPKYYSRKTGHGGAFKRIFTKTTLKKALLDKKISPAQIDKLSGVCIVLKNNNLLTAYHL